MKLSRPTCESNCRKRKKPENLTSVRNFYEATFT